MIEINGKYIIYIVIQFLFTSYMMGQTEFGSRKVSTIVIDPGHGGRDPGAIGRTAKEKEIVLSISQKLGKLINQRFPDVKVVYTRSDDQFVELFQRAEIANKAKADLFISIHANSTTKQSPSGVEFWVLGLHKADENLEAVKKENAALQFEQDVRKNYGFDPNSPEGSIIMTMQQNLYLDQSIQVAKLMESRFVREDNQLNRGSKQAGFIVLYKTSMPSVLVEVGFISNPDEEQYISNETGQLKIATNLANAFADYKLKYESGAIKQVTKSIEKKAVPNLPIENSDVANNGFTKASSNGNGAVNMDESAPIAEVVKKENPLVAANAKPVSSDLDVTSTKKKIIIEDDEVEKYSKSNSSLPKGETNAELSKDKTIQNQVPVKAPSKASSSILEAKPGSKTIITDEDVEAKKKPALTSTPIAEKFEKKTNPPSTKLKVEPVLPTKEEMKKDIINNSINKVEDKSKPILKINTNTVGKIKKEESNSSVPSYLGDEDTKKEIVSNTKRIDKRNNILEDNTLATKSESKSNTASDPAEAPVPKTAKTEIASVGIIYKVQVKASTIKLKTDDPINSILKRIEESFENNMFKYLVGSYKNEGDAKDQLEKVRNQGIKDAFIVKYKDGVRIK